MFAGDRHEAIGNHEELIFSLVYKDKANFPELVNIYQYFYDDPLLKSSQVEQILRELILLKSKFSCDSSINQLVDRLFSFFEYAKSESLIVRCESD